MAAYVYPSPSSFSPAQRTPTEANPTPTLPHLQIENPEARMQLHMLLRLAERSEQEGGLGLVRASLDLCCFGLGLPQKRSNWWVPREWASHFFEQMPGGGATAHFRCTCNGPHQQQVAGHNDRDRRRVCAYPPELSALYVSLSLATVRARRRRSVIGEGGNYERCAECGDFGFLVCCDTCPRAHHLKCMVESARRRVRHDDNKYSCEMCLALNCLVQPRA